MNPVIGCTISYDEDRIFIEKTLNSIHKNGGIPLFLPYTENDRVIEKYLNICDGFLLGGGLSDISPSCYGEQNIGKSVYIDPPRDAFEILLAKKIISNNIPTLGICRGMQILNIAAGGTLIQDIPLKTKGVKGGLNNELNHLGDWVDIDKHKRSPNLHEIVLSEGTCLHKLMNTSVLTVNSYHHQAIKKLAKCFTTSSAGTDGIIESIEHVSGAFIIGTQWHVELDSELDANSIILRKLILESDRDNA